MSTASELLIEQPVDTGEGAISQGSPSRPQAGLKEPVASWLQGVEDAELREFIQNKGWTDPGEMAQGYRNLEKLVGGEKVPLPKGDNDTEGWERVYKALGRPAKPEDYQLPDLESAEAYHNLGLTARQATGLSAWQDTLIHDLVDPVSLHRGCRLVAVTLAQNLHPSHWSEEIVMVQFKFVVVHMRSIGLSVTDLPLLLHTAIEPLLPAHSIR